MTSGMKSVLLRVIHYDYIFCSTIYTAEGGADTRVHSNQDLIWCVGRGVYSFFWVHRGF